MKPFTKLLTSIIMIMLLQNSVYAQSDISGVITGHAGTSSTYYCGWDNTTLFDLNIEHRGGYNINFLCGTPLNQYMTIQGPGATNPGFVGIGTTGPLRLLDLLDANNPQLRLTQTSGTNFLPPPCPCVAWRQGGIDATLSLKMRQG